jgi:hypothetical protein
MVKNDEEVYMKFMWNIQQQTTEHVEVYYECMLKLANCVVTLALGSRPRQRLAKVWAKCEGQESHFMLPKMWENVREWTPHSQVSSHFGSWSLDGFPNLHKVITGVKINWIEEFLISLEISWNMTHLDTSNTSYGQKKGWESNCQFDFWPLKVGNCFDFLAFRWRATYFWKDLDKGYNFALNIIVIKGFHTKLWAPKVARVPTLGISGLPLGSHGTKWHLGVGPVTKHKIYYKGEGGGFPQVRAVVSLMSPCLPMVRSCTKVFQLHINQLIV